MTAATVSTNGTPRWVRALARWETLLAVALIGLIVLGNALSPFFLTPQNFSNLIAALMEVAIMALPMTLIIIIGEIDLSVESMAGLASAILGFLWAAGVPIEIGIPIVLVAGALGGLLNGLMVARGGLPSLVVTLGTLALFRGFALISGPTRHQRLPTGLYRDRFRDSAGHVDPVAVRHLRRPGRDPRDRAPPHVGRPADLRHSARTPVLRATRGSASRESESACSSCPG